MTTPNQAYRQAANSPAGRQAAETVKDARETVKSAAETARNIGDDVADFASDVSRKAGKQFARAQDMAVDAYDEVHDASVRNPYLTLAIAAGLGFLFGAFLVGRR
jgi:ElaB/YqjD/DUF883 family membrane-anchored ribosome-binding protein